MYTGRMARVTVRQRVLDYVRDHPDAAADQVARGLGLSSASCRHHLGILQRDGRISLAGVHPRKSKGRPAKLYRLSERLRGDNLGGLADVLLTEARGLLGNRWEDLEARLVQGLEGKVGPIEHDAATVSRNLGLLVDRLNALHYEASWEAGAQGPRVLLGHCPYAAIIADHPELCRVDARMLQGKLGVKVAQVSKIESRAGGQARCTFVLK